MCARVCPKLERPKLRQAFCSALCIASHVASVFFRGHMPKGHGKVQRFAQASSSLVWLLAGLGLLALAIFGSEGASYAVIPGVRGPHLTIPLDEPLPYSRPTPQVSEVALDPELAGMPLPIMPDQATQPPALPAQEAEDTPTAPLSFSGRFDTGPAAQPYVFKGQSAEDQRRAALCLTAAIYYEAASESDDGQRAVAQVVLNRVRHPAWPATVCGVIYQGSDRPGCQFSYACDGSMARLPSLAGWARAARIAREALAGYVHAPVGLATFYHTLKVNPIWNRNMTITNVIGAHIFFRLPGGKSAPAAFSDQYAGREPFPGPLPRRAPWPSPNISGAGSTALAYADTSGQPQALPRVKDDSRYVKGALPDSDILPRYRDSGRWIGN